MFALRSPKVIRLLPANMEKFWGENVHSTPASIASGWIESTESHVILGGVVVVCCLFTFAAHRAVIFTIVQLSCLSTGDFTPIKVMHTGTLLYLSHLVSYSPSRVLRWSSSFNLLQVPTLTLFSVPTHSVQLLQVFGTLFLTHSFHLVHSTLSCGTSKRTFTKQLLIPPSGILQRLRFTYVTNGTL